MQVQMAAEEAARYTNNSQKARVVSEGWIESEAYCPACRSPRLERLPHGHKVVDFRCPRCDEGFQAKSTSKPIGNRVLDSAYGTMIRAVQNDEAPNLMLLSYSREEWVVRDLLVIPRHLFTASVVEKKNPIRPGRKRPGWVGCNLILDRIPDEGRVYAIENSHVRSPSKVRLDWQRVQFAKELAPEPRGWVLDVWRCVERLGRDRFTLQDIYGFEEDLSGLHPSNLNVRPKIRQQLQVLRDKGRLSFEGAGRYRLI